MTSVLEMKDITKQFPGVLANDKVDFDLKEGEIHALLGENGAGKSTLMNILYGLIHPDHGEIIIRGKTHSIRSPLDALDLGIGMVHQHFMLVNTMTVAENIMLGRELKWGPFLKNREAEHRIEQLSEEYQISVSPRALIGQLSVGEQQRVEILKALYRGADILILDEPTAVLTPTEVETLFKTLRSMLQRGKSIIFITHKLREVMAISNRVTVLRRGKRVTTANTAEVDERQLAQMMVGRDVVLSVANEQRYLTSQKLIASLEQVRITRTNGRPILRDVSLTMYAGEIVGIAGVDGNGQSELAEVIAGLRRPDRGKVLVNGKDLTDSDPEARIENGIWYVPADRKDRGSVISLSVANNAILKHHRWQPFSRRGVLDRKQSLDFAERLVKKYDVRCSSLNVRAETLSGGNLQKLILARETVNRPELLIAEQPTRGLDIGATEYVRRLLLEQRGEGSSILLISADLDEIMALSNRILVMYEGAIVYECYGNNVNLEKIGLAMAGFQGTGHQMAVPELDKEQA